MIGNYGGTTLNGIAYDYTTETMFGVSSTDLYTIDIVTGEATLVVDVPSGYTMGDVACDNDGVLIATTVDFSAQSHIGIIEKTTGAWTLLATAPFVACYAQGMSCDHTTNTIYWSAYNYSAGGISQLYIINQATGECTLVGSFPNGAEVDGFAIPGTSGGGGGQIPPGLLGYNIYCNGEYINYIPHPTTTFLMENIQPGIYYSFTVTAVYDLVPYGGPPGETGESMEEGPAILSSCCCFDLEFTENWDFGSFETNYWTPTDTNWRMSGQTGNPAPSAKFSWDPIQTDYAISLESYDMCSEGMTEGNIWMDWDLKLNSYNPTGEEFLNIQVWTWDLQEWTTVQNYSTIDGSFDWTPAHLNISAQAMGRTFRVRFQAQGTNSLNILSWFVDNIRVYRTCEPITDLVSTVLFPPGNSIKLTWTPPAEPSEESYNNMANNQSSVNLTSEMKRVIRLSNGSRELYGYNIYRNMEGGPFELIGFTDQNTYTDPDLPFGFYCYEVTAVYTSETDFCESNFSSETCEMFEDIDEQANSARFSMYPNPATSEVFIYSNNELRRVTVYTTIGQLVADKITTGTKYILNIASYKAGMYMIRVETETGVSTRALTVHK